MSEPNDVRERLAALAHAQWAGWMRYQFACMREDEAGRYVMGTAEAARWRRQMCTAYEELAEDEKESERKEADRVLALLDAFSDQMAEVAIRNLQLYNQNGQLLVENQRLRARVAELEEAAARSGSAEERAP